MDSLEMEGIRDVEILMGWDTFIMKFTHPDDDRRAALIVENTGFGLAYDFVQLND